MEREGRERGKKRSNGERGRRGLRKEGVMERAGGERVKKRRSNGERGKGRGLRKGVMERKGRGEG